jgi:hypothetical protein
MNMLKSFWREARPIIVFAPRSSWKKKEKERWLKDVRLSIVAVAGISPSSKLSTGLRPAKRRPSGLKSLIAVWSDSMIW